MTRKTTKVEIVDVDPGPAPRRIDWAAVTRAADDNPGRWALVHDRMEPSVAGHINGGRYAGVDPDRYEAISRNQKVDGDGKRTADILIRVRP